MLVALVVVWAASARVEGYRSVADAEARRLIFGSHARVKGVAMFAEVRNQFGLATQSRIRQTAQKADAGTDSKPPPRPKKGVRPRGKGKNSSAGAAESHPRGRGRSPGPSPANRKNRAATSKGHATGGSEGNVDGHNAHGTSPKVKGKGKGISAGLGDGARPRGHAGPAEVEVPTLPQKPVPIQQQARDVPGLLGAMSKGAGTVAVVTMLGTFNPITLAHIQAVTEARTLLLGLAQRRLPDLEAFDEVVALIFANSDGHVKKKLAKKGEAALTHGNRGKLVEFAIADYNWMQWSSRTGRSSGDEEMQALRTSYPRLKFEAFAVNGADDVVANQKWKEASPENRMITMGRPGSTEELQKGMTKAGVKETKNFLLGPELPDVSSTKVRKALKEGKDADLDKMLDPKVKEWCLNNRDLVVGSAGVARKVFSLMPFR